MSNVFNIPIVKLNGVDYRTKPNTTIKLGGTKSEPRYASGILSGFAEEPEAAEISGAYELMSDTDIEGIRNFKDGQAEFITDVGIVFASKNARHTDTLELTPGDGVKFKIMGEVTVKS